MAVRWLIPMTILSNPGGTMKRFVIKTLGVTLLEVLLVLAVGAMIIVMSIRYYQSAAISQQANMAMEQIQAITAAADNLAIGSGSYMTSASQNTIQSLVGVAGMTSPTGSPIQFNAIDASRYRVDIPVNNAICTSVTAKLAAINKITNVQACGTSISYIYDNTQ